MNGKVIVISKILQNEFQQMAETAHDRQLHVVDLLESATGSSSTTRRRKTVQCYTFTNIFESHSEVTMVDSLSAEHAQNRSR